MTSLCWSWRKTLTLQHIHTSGQSAYQLMTARTTMTSWQLYLDGEPCPVVDQALTSWGRWLWRFWPTQNARMLMVPHQSLTRCSVPMSMVVGKMLAKETQVRIYPIVFHSNICFKGGPLVSSGSGDGETAGENYELIGVVSWGAGCAEEQYPGVYSRVTEQLTWISSTTSAGWSTCPRVWLRKKKYRSGFISCISCK